MHAARSFGLFHRGGLCQERLYEDREPLIFIGQGTWDQWARQEVTSYRDTSPSPVNRMTGACKNIILSQTFFVGGNKV